MPEMDDVKVMSMNCRGLAGIHKRRDVLHFICQKDYNIVFLQDTHMTIRQIQYFDCLWKGKSLHSCFSSHSRGTAILIRNNMQYNIITEIKSDSGNYVIIVCKIGADAYAFINVYGPNEDSPTFFENLSEQIDNLEVDHIIIAGDFNFVINPEADSLNYVQENNKRGKQAFLQIANKHKLTDLWRYTHPSEQKYTWRRMNPFKCGRLDMFFVSDHLVNVVGDVDIAPGYRTDHNMITMSFRIGQTPRGSGLWKLNTSHLVDDAYIQTIQTCIHEVLQQYAVPLYHPDVYNDINSYPYIELTINECQFYETLIMMIRGESVKYSKQKARRHRKLEKQIEAEIREAQNKLAASGTHQDAVLVDTVKKKLENIREPMIEGLITRSRVTWHEQGERSSQYFLSLEKRNFQRKTINFIQDGEQKIVRTDKIIDKFTNNLQKKYNSDDNDLTEATLISDNITNELNFTDNERLDKLLTLQDLTKALQSMKKGKTPGSNGFPAEFFRLFWPEIGPFLYRAFISSLLKNQKLPSHREGIITLIPKQNKPAHFLNSWRPITLLNVDYKIVSAAISSRLQSVMNSLISSTQTAYISGRYIGENTRLIFDLIAHTESTKTPGMILAADFQAAFETVSWSYLRAVMNKFNFGPNFMKMIDLMYLNPNSHSRILLNGFLGEKIYLQRGIRQGDPASGYLFNLAVALLSEQITKSNLLTGIRITQTQEIRISQYADDTILILDGTDRSLKGAINELVRFASISGLKVNIEKTSCMPIGSLQDYQVPNGMDIKLVNEIKILGI